jgi:carboxypeptidase PM20D1
VGDSSKTSVIPDRAEATLECSLLPGQDVNALLTELRKIINDPRVTLSASRRQPVIKSEIDSSITSPFDTELFRIIEQETKKIYPESITIPSVVIYPTDSRLFRPKGAVCYGFFPGIITMDDYRTIHLNNERIRVESFTTAVKIYYNVVKELCREK